jgi:hypothetical protein
MPTTQTRIRIVLLALLLAAAAAVMAMGATDDHMMTAMSGSFADGSTRHVSDSIDSGSWTSAVTSAGGEVVGND